MTAGTLEADLCVLGGGAGGLATAIGAARMGARVVLVEAERLGGECLHSGCVPSKSLLAIARAEAEAARGFDAETRAEAFERARRHVARTIRAIAHHDSEERLRALGVQLVRGAGRFTGPRELEAAGVRIRARRFVVATGSRPHIPDIPGLAGANVLTTDDIFGLESAPEHLLVVGAGPSGVELAQAFRRLGSRVSVVEAHRMLGGEDPELVDWIRRALAREGIELFEGIADLRAGPAAALRFRWQEREVGLSGSHLLLACGRRPRVDGLGLEEAGVGYDHTGIRVDRRLRTTNRRIYAVGDVIGRAPYSHAAAHEAQVVLKQALLRIPARPRHCAIPRVVYTDPELAQVGESEAEARARGETVEVIRIPFAESDRARCEGREEGLVKLVVGRRRRLLGAGVVGPQAGELIAPLVLAVDGRLPLHALAAAPFPYPTRMEAVKRAAGRALEPLVFGTWTRRLVRALAALG